VSELGGIYGTLKYIAKVPFNVFSVRELTFAF